jgi:hypothetical protein
MAILSGGSLLGMAFMFFVFMPWVMASSWPTYERVCAVLSVIWLLSLFIGWFAARGLDKDLER